MKLYILLLVLYFSLIIFPSGQLVAVQETNQINPFSVEWLTRDDEDDLLQLIQMMPEEIVEKATYKISDVSRDSITLKDGSRYLNIDPKVDFTRQLEVGDKVIIFSDQEGISDQIWLVPKNTTNTVLSAVLKEKIEKSFLSQEESATVEIFTANAEIKPTESNVILERLIVLDQNTSLLLDSSLSENRFVFAIDRISSDLFAISYLPDDLRRTMPRTEMPPLEPKVKVVKIGVSLVNTENKYQILTDVDNAEKWIKLPSRGILLSDSGLVFLLNNSSSKKETNIGQAPLLAVDEEDQSIQFQNKKGKIIQYLGKLPEIEELPVATLVSKIHKMFEKDRRLRGFIEFDEGMTVNSYFEHLEEKNSLADFYFKKLNPNWGAPGIVDSPRNIRNKSNLAFSTNLWIQDEKDGAIKLRTPMHYFLASAMDEVLQKGKFKAKSKKMKQVASLLERDGDIDSDFFIKHEDDTVERYNGTKLFDIVSNKVFLNSKYSEEEKALRIDAINMLEKFVMKRTKIDIEARNARNEEVHQWKIVLDLIDEQNWS